MLRLNDIVQNICEMSQGIRVISECEPVAFNEKHRL